MHCEAFKEILHQAEEMISIIRKDLGKFEGFLKNAYPVITVQNKQFRLRRDLTVLYLAERCSLLKESDFKDNLLCITKHLEETLASEKNARGNYTTDAARKKEIGRKIQALKDEMATFTLDELEIIEDFSIELIFPSVKIEAIQAVKRHPLTNKDKTCMSTCCIRVYLF